MNFIEWWKYSIIHVSNSLLGIINTRYITGSRDLQRQNLNRHDWTGLVFSNCSTYITYKSIVMTSYICRRTVARISINFLGILFYPNTCTWIELKNSITSSKWRLKCPFTSISRRRRKIRMLFVFISYVWYIPCD